MNLRLQQMSYFTIQTQHKTLLKLNTKKDVDLKKQTFFFPPRADNSKIVIASSNFLKQ